MPRESHPQKKVAAFPTARARFALAGQADALAFVHATRDFDLVGFHFLGTAAPQRDLAGGTVQRFFQRDHDVGLDILPAFRRRRTPAEAAAERRLAASAAEERFEKIAEPGPAEFKLHAAAVAAADRRKPPPAPPRPQSGGG